MLLFNKCCFVHFLNSDNYVINDKNSSPLPCHLIKMKFHPLQMTTITFYKQRLRAMIFKSDFKDTINELHQVRSNSVMTKKGWDMKFVNRLVRMFITSRLQSLFCAQIRNSSRYWRCHEYRIYIRACFPFYLFAFAVN